VTDSDKPAAVPENVSEPLRPRKVNPFTDPDTTERTVTLLRRGYRRRLARLAREAEPAEQNKPAEVEISPDDPRIAVFVGFARYVELASRTRNRSTGQGER
jgi:hypothetical protein